MRRHTQRETETEGGKERERERSGDKERGKGRETHTHTEDSLRVAATVCRHMRLVSMVDQNTKKVNNKKQLRNSATFQGRRPLFSNYKRTNERLS